MRVSRMLEVAIHALLLGTVLGIVVGAIEYAMLRSAGAMSGVPAGAYWSVIAPHAVVGAVGGLVVGLVAALIGRRREGRIGVILHVWPPVIAATVFAYLVIWATYLLARPIVKLSNALAYLGAALVAIALGFLIHWALRRALGVVERRGERAVGHARMAIPLALAVVVVLSLGVPATFASRTSSAPATGSAASGAANRPNILIVLLDATRADHLSLFGYSRATDPNLKAFASKGMAFTRMFAQAPSTRPSVATLFSSLSPAVHRANDDRDFLSDSFVLLPEVLRNAGYTTFGISANANVSPTFGYAQGFDEFIVWKAEAPFRLTLLGRFAEDLLGPARLTRLLHEHRELIPVAESVTDTTLAWATKHAKKPFFMYVHYIDPHYPYRPPAPYNQAFDYRRDPPRRRGGTVDPASLATRNEYRDLTLKTLDQYDGEILYADHHIGRLLDGLQAAGLLDNTIVVFTADHGEEFYEHDNIGHAKSVYEEVLWIPFFMVWPGKIPAGTATGQMVGLIDVMPTLLSMVGLQAPPLVQGKTFAAMLADPKAPAGDRTLYAQVVNKGFSMDMARNATYKFIFHGYGPRHGSEEYYDLQGDPLERANLGVKAPAPAMALRKELTLFNDIVARAANLTKPEQVKKLDRDTERALRSLGYIK